MSLLSFPGKVMEEILLESTAKPRKAKKVMGSGRRGFTKGKWCLSDLRVFHVEATGCWRRGEQWLLLLSRT